MTKKVIVDGLSKQYRIGQLNSETMLRDALANIFRRHFRKKQLETIWALKEVSFKVDAGEICGIIGRNGAGKSTLLKILSKITTPTSGNIDVRGRIASLLEVGTGFHEELTGKENIYLNGSILGMKKKEIDARLDEVIAFSGIEKFIDTPIKRYSSGMRLRLGFSVAAHLNTDILLIDEILAVGDAEFQRKCLKTMGELRNSGRTVLFVSHNMVAVENLCPRVIWIDKGKVKEDGKGSEIIKKYLSTSAGTRKAGFDLLSIEDRGGNGEIRFTGIEYLGFDGRSLKMLRTGEGLIVKLYYTSRKQITNPHFAFDLYSESGIKVSSFNTWISGFEIPVLSSGEGSLEIEIEALNLRADRYYVSLWLASAGNIWYDRIDHCAILDIEASDFYSSGREMNTQHCGVVLFPCKWKLN